MTLYTAASIFVLALGAVYFAYWAGWKTGFDLGKQRGWSNGYHAAKVTERVTQDEVFDYEKN